MRQSRRDLEHRAAPATSPEPTRGLKRKREEFRLYREGREAVERRSMVRGLILLAVVVMVVSIARAGLDRVFVAGWWRP
jgi:hypothetical protein